MLQFDYRCTVIKKYGRKCLIRVLSIKLGYGLTAIMVKVLGFKTFIMRSKKTIASVQWVTHNK